MNNDHPFLYFDSRYAPCGFLIVRAGASPYSDDPADTVLVQTDWDFPGVAASCGMVMDDDEPEATSRAYDWLRERHGEAFAGLEEYFT